MRSRILRRWTAIAATILILGTFVQVSFASESPDQADDAGLASVPIGFGGGAVSQVRAVGDTAAHTRTSTTWANLPGATINIPLANPGFLFARFGAESSCFGAPSGWCSVRIMVNGVQANPAAGIDFAFDSPDAGAESNQSWEGHFMERFTHCLPPGNYNVTVQWASRQVPGDPIPTFRLDDWSLLVESVNGCQQFTD